MKISKMLAALLAALMLSACVGFIVPLPSRSTTTVAPAADQEEKR